MADTQYRGLAGTGGRALLITNGWDLAENSVAQQLAEAHEPDVYVDHVKAPEHLKYTVKADRQRIHRIVYGDSAIKLDRAGQHLSGWVNLDRIESDAGKLVKKDPAQAERFFGNRTPTGSGAWMPDGVWDARTSARTVPAGTRVCVGFDGSDANDWTGIRLETEDFFQFTPADSLGRPCVWNPLDKERCPEGRVPRLEVMAAFEHIFATYDVVRAYLDPPLWQTEVNMLQGRFGERVAIEWPTYRIKPMHAALERFRDDVVNDTSRFTHDGDPDTAMHVRNAIKRARSGETYIIGKPADHQKIDLAMSSTLAHEAVSDAIAAGDFNKTTAAAISRTFFGFG